MAGGRLGSSSGTSGSSSPSFDSDSVSWDSSSSESPGGSDDQDQATDSASASSSAPEGACVHVQTAGPQLLVHHFLGGSLCERTVFNSWGRRRRRGPEGQASGRPVGIREKGDRRWTIVDGERRYMRCRGQTKLHASSNFKQLATCSPAPVNVLPPGEIPSSKLGYVRLQWALLGCECRAPNAVTPVG